ncbi:MAG: carbon-nitrogen hydrolase family protein [Candidatus Bathyarchaeia archaeon]
MVNGKMTFAAVQMAMKIGDVEANIAKAEKFIDDAVSKYRPDIIGLPEFFNTEYFPQYVDRKYFAYAEPIPGPTTERMSKKAKEHGVYIIAPIYEKAGRGVYYDSSPVIAPDGKVLGITRKVELPNVWFKEGGVWANEDFYYSSGNLENAYLVYNTKIGNIGQIICFNRHYPETWRKLTMKGAEVIFVPVASMGKFLGDMFTVEMRAMAYVHQCFGVVLNRVGVEGEHRMYGGSHIVGPKGQYLAGPASDTKEEILCATLDLGNIDEARQQVPFTKSFHTSSLRSHLLYDQMNKSGPERVEEKSEYGSAF